MLLNGMVSWRTSLQKFDEDKVFPSIFFSQYPSKTTRNRKILVEDVIQGEKPLEVNDNPEAKYTYDGVYTTKVNEWPVTISEVEVSTRGLKRYGAIIDIQIAEMNDSTLTLNVIDMNFLGCRYGSFLAVKNKERTCWPWIKFDVKVQYCGKELYDFVDDLIDLCLDKKCKTAVEIKPLGVTSNWDLYLGGSHLYPRFEKNTSLKEQKERLKYIYYFGKERWGGSFKMNPHLEGVGGDRPLNKYLRTISQDNL